MNQQLEKYLGRHNYDEVLDRLRSSALLPLAQMQKKAYRLMKRALKGEELTTLQWKAIRTVLHETQRQLNRHEGKPLQKTETKHEGDFNVKINLKEDK